MFLILSHHFHIAKTESFTGTNMKYWNMSHVTSIFHLKHGKKVLIYAYRDYIIQRVSNDETIEFSFSFILRINGTFESLRINMGFHISIWMNVFWEKCQNKRPSNYLSYISVHLYFFSCKYFCKYRLKFFLSLVFISF